MLARLGQALRRLIVEHRVGAVLAQPGQVQLAHAGQHRGRRVEPAVIPAAATVGRCAAPRGAAAAPGTGA